MHLILSITPKGNKPLEKRGYRWEDNIKTDIKETGCKFVDWIQLAQDRVQWRAVVKMAMNFRVL
jgi:hypothetical protein